MDDAVISSADVKLRLCIYLRTSRNAAVKLRTREPFLEVEQRLGKQRLKGLRGVR